MKNSDGDKRDGKDESLGPVLADIGGELARHVEGDPDGMFLYAEAGEGWYAVAVFKEESDQVRYYSPTSELGDLVWEVWNSEEPEKRWAVMEYEIKGRKFDVQFQFPDEIDPKETEMDRRPRVIERRFGDKPVVYPPWPSE
ncbi:MAG: hypothetical protein H0W65_06120 [Sphingomonas sp.]|uniref:hypothetical protein n=1 Tax=Sphingomonas sp. TaxID=28214 RepID=UPI0017DC41AB|nr:hypothetical protein [Sphingomonas sp.]MBA3667281.1 hypothetical protein [Sphingomonas sp.]